MATTSVYLPFFPGRSTTVPRSPMRSFDRRLIVLELVALLRRCDRADVLLEDCLAAAEAQFLLEVDGEVRHAGEGSPGEGPQE